MSEPSPGKTPADVRAGVTAAVTAYVIWGFLPIYFKLVSFTQPLELLGHRVLWSVPAAIIIVVIAMGWREGFAAVAAAFRGRMIALLSAAALLIFANWGLYIYAVAQGHVMEAALAYFLSPLALALTGIFAFGERVRRLQAIALVLAGIGLVVQGLALGAPPWLALFLCASWTGYALIRRSTPVAAPVGLLVETIVLIPIAGGLLWWLSQQPGGAPSHDAGEMALIALSGVITAAPLMLFAYGARRLMVTTIGMLNYIAPALQFLVGLAYGELLTPLRAVSFALIWAALIVFTWDALSRRAPATGNHTAP